MDAIRSAGEIFRRRMQIRIHPTPLRAISASLRPQTPHGPRCSATAWHAGFVIVALGLTLSGPARAQNRLFAWGDFGGPTNVPAGIGEVIGMDSGSSHGLGLLADGTVVGWGGNGSGQITIPEGLVGVVQIAAGSSHSLALRGDGTVAGWGHPASGQSPAGLTGVRAIAGGGYHSLALLSNRTVVAWGGNSQGQINVPPDLTNAVAIAAGDSFSVALTEEGTAVAWGSISRSQTNLVAIGAGRYHARGIRPDGIAFYWGNTYESTLDWTNVVAITGGHEHSLGLLQDGRVLSRNNTSYGTSHPVPGYVSNVFAIAPTPFGGMALANQGAAAIVVPPHDRLVLSGAPVQFHVRAAGLPPLHYHWQFEGADLPGETNATLALPAVTTARLGVYSVSVSNALGSQAASALLRMKDQAPLILTHPASQTIFPNGTARFDASTSGSLPMTFQWYHDGQLLEHATHASLLLPPAHAGLAGTYAVGVSNSFGTATSSNASLVLVPIAAWGLNPPHWPDPQVAELLADAIDLSGGSAFTAILRADRRMALWTADNLLEGPAEFSHLVKLSAGAQHVLGLRADGSVVAWGDNSRGQSSVPPNLGAAIDIAAGPYHSLALRADGRVVAWGQNDFAQTAVPTWADDAVAVAGGTDRSLVVRRDGTVAVWGETYSGCRAVPPDLTNAIAVASGSDFCLALRRDGTVIAWGGRNLHGQLDVPSALSNVVAITADYWSSLALRSDGTVIGWGMESSSTNLLPEAQVPTGLTNAVALAHGGRLGLALVAGRPLFLLDDPDDVTVWETSAATLTVDAHSQLPLSYQWFFNDAPLPGATQPALVLSPAAARLAGHYHAVIANAFGSITSSPSQLTVRPLSLGEQLNAPELSWSTTGAAPWFPQLATHHDADGAAQAGMVAPGDESILCTRLEGPATVRFWWRTVSAAMGVLSFQIDEVEQVRISGTTDWELQQHYLPAGTVDLAWRWHKDPASAGGSDGAWVDEVSVIAEATLPIIRSDLQDHSVWIYQDLTLTVQAEGTPPLHYQWQCNGLDLPGANSPELSLTALQLADSGSYRVIVANAYGETASAPAQVTVTQVAAWGTNAYGQLDVPPAAADPVALTAGRDHNLALRRDGTVVAWGSDEFGQASVPPALTNAVAIAAGRYHSLALNASGNVVVWGSENYGATHLPTGLSNISAIAAGFFHNLALTQDGEVFAWGEGSRGQTTVPPGLSNVVAVAGGLSHSLALRADGTVTGWGGISAEHAAYLATLRDVQAIAAGYGYGASSTDLSTSVALHENGTLSAYGWQTFDPTELATESNQVAISAPSYHLLALDREGHVRAWGRDVAGQATVPAGLNNLGVVGIAAGRDHSLALIGTGTPLLVRQPWTQLAASGTPVTLKSFAFGAEPLAYQWHRDGVPLTGETGPSLTLTNLQAADTASYVVIVSNSFGQASSRPARVTVVHTPPTIVTGPSDQTVWAGDPVVMETITAGSRPQMFQWFHNGQELAAATNATLTLGNLGPGTSEYFVVVANAFGAATSAVAVATVDIAIGDALDAPDLEWSSLGTAPWFGQTNITYDQTHAQQSGPIGPNGQSHLITTLTGPGTLSFWWKVSSEAGADFLRCLRFPLTVRSISGEVDWTHEVVPLPAGTWSIRWVYQKNGAVDAGVDAGWLDQVVYTPDGQLPVILSHPQSQSVAGGTNVLLSVTANGNAPLSYFWQKDDRPLPDATGTELALFNVARRDSGSYSVLVSNAVGTAQSHTALLVVRVPQLLQFPERLPSGNLQITFADADGNPLPPALDQQFTVESSTNLLHWEPLPGSLQLLDGRLTIQDERPPAPARFYRAIEQGP